MAKKVFPRPVLDKWGSISYNRKAIHAGMAELADAPDLGSGVPDVQVQVLLPAPKLS